MITEKVIKAIQIWQYQKLLSLSHLVCLLNNSPPWRSPCEELNLDVPPRDINLQTGSKMQILSALAAKHKHQWNHHSEVQKADLQPQSGTWNTTWCVIVFFLVFLVLLHKNSRFSILCWKNILSKSTFPLFQSVFLRISRSFCLLLPFPLNFHYYPSKLIHWILDSLWKLKESFLPNLVRRTLLLPLSLLRKLTDINCRHAS